MDVRGDQTSQKRLEWCGERGAPTVQELRSLARDVTNTGHGRGYRGIAVYFDDFPRLAKSMGGFRFENKRVWGYELRARYFQSPGGGHGRLWISWLPNIICDG